MPAKQVPICSSIYEISSTNTYMIKNKKWGDENNDENNRKKFDCGKHAHSSNCPIAEGRVIKMGKTIGGGKIAQLI